MIIDFTPHTETYTVVYDGEGNEIDRLSGAVFVSGKNYADKLPIEFRHVRVTKQVINAGKVESPNKKNQ